MWDLHLSNSWLFTALCIQGSFLHIFRDTGRAHNHGGVPLDIGDYYRKPLGYQSRTLLTELL